MPVLGVCEECGVNIDGLYMKWCGRTELPVRCCDDHEVIVMKKFMEKVKKTEISEKIFNSPNFTHSLNSSI